MFHWDFDGPPPEDPVRGPLDLLRVERLRCRRDVRAVVQGATATDLRDHGGWDVKPFSEPRRAFRWFVVCSMCRFSFFFDLPGGYLFISLLGTVEKGRNAAWEKDTA